MSYTEALAEAYACSPTNATELHTLEISHPSVAGPFYLVKNTEPLTLTLEDGSTHVFEAANFEITLPAKTDEGIQDLQLKICNADRRVSDFMEQASHFQTKVVCKYRPYLSTVLTEPGMNPPLLLTLSDIVATVYEVTARASFADLVNRSYPSEKYSYSIFPSLRA